MLCGQRQGWFRQHSAAEEVVYEKATRPVRSRGALPSRRKGKTLPPVRVGVTQKEG